MPALSKNPNRPPGIRPALTFPLFNQAGGFDNPTTGTPARVLIEMR
jgi:hypothetical protein